MIVPNSSSAVRLAGSFWAPALYFTGVTLAVEWSYYTFGSSRSVFSLATAGLMITALSIFLGFRVNEAYERWWEARKLWGSMVNVSRSLARKVSTMIVCDRVAALEDEAAAMRARTEIIHRHIAYVNAVRIGLRHGSSYQSAPEQWQDLRPLLSEEEFRSYSGKANVATQLLRAQSESCRRLFGDTPQEELAYLELQRTLDELYDVQGACERIKNTVFPYAITMSTKAFVWAFATLLPFAALDADLKLDVVEISLCVSMSLSFVIIEHLGEDLKTPFENQQNDTPMTALCRTIEIDLREMLGETDVPPPLQPVGGVLM